MKALILCGGFATRLEPITYFIPKPLLPIGAGGKPIIEYILDDVIRSGISEITISTNSKFEGSFRYWLGLRINSPGIRVSMVVEPSKNNAEKYGAIKGIEYAIEKEKIDDDLTIIAGDNLYDFSVKDMLLFYEKRRKPTIALYDIKSADEAKRFGVVRLSGERISAFAEKPANPESTLISTGIYIFPKESLKYFGIYLKNSANTDSIGNFIEWLIKNSEVLGYVYKGRWFDIGTLETYRRAFDTFLQWKE
ncbi:MAG: nucleotidyltransferase family protein [Candidatus Micrarchaeaceae archaeon]